MPYYKSGDPIRLILYNCFGNDIGVPPYDWKANVCANSKFDVMFEASHTDGVYKNAFVNHGDGHVWLHCRDRHKFTGTVLIDFVAYVHDESLPGGIREIATLIDTGIYMADRPTAVLPPQQPVTVPAGVVAAVTQFATDVEYGKRRVADALTRQGVPTQPGEPLADIADKVLDLRLAVEGEPGVVEQSWNMPGYTDLLNLLRNRQRADLPYCYGIRHGLNTVNLTGADAYLCSDGYFSRDGGEHRFTDTGDRWIIYYNAAPDYVVTAPTPCIEIVALNGRPQFSLSGVTVGSVRSYTRERYELQGGITGFSHACTETVLCGITATSAIIGQSQKYLWLPDLETSTNMLSSIGSGVTRLYLPKYSRHTAGTLFNQASGLTELLLPALTTVSGGQLLSEARSLAELSLPALTTLSGGSLLSGNTLITHISLPALSTLTGGTIAESVPTLESITLAGLVEVNSVGKAATIWGRCGNSFKANVYLPNLLRATGGLQVFQGAPSVGAHVYMPSCIYFNGVALFQGGESHVHMHFGSDIEFIRAEQFGGTGGTIHIYIAPGAKTAVRANTILDPESMHAFIANLGDNTGGETLQLQIGAVNIAALSQEDIEMATSKNYTLS